MAVEEYWAPTALPAALEHLRGGEVTILAGGTDLMPQSHAGRVTLKRGLLNLRRVPELHGVERVGAAVRIGALCTISELMADPLVRAHFGLLAEACDHFASDQLRNAATLGGNVCNASPAGDTLPPLLALDAEAELASKPNGGVETRRVPLAEFFVGPGPDGPRAERAADRAVAPGAAGRLHRPLLQVRHAAGAGHRRHRHRHRRRARRGARSPAPGSPTARSRRCRCGRVRPKRRWRARRSTPRPSPGSPASPATRCVPSTTCAPRPGTAASWCST